MRSECMISTLQIVSRHLLGIAKNGQFKGLQEYRPGIHSQFFKVYGSLNGYSGGGPQ